MFIKPCHLIMMRFFCYFAIAMIRPQPGPQEQFLSTSADIAFYGGSAGGGKTFMLLMEPMRHFMNARFSGVIFRRTMPQVNNPGGLWDTSQELYNLAGGTPRDQMKDWRFPSGAKMVFRHLQHEKDKNEWQGSQIPFIGFDEVTHFTKTQFMYFLSRNRSTSGVKGYMRATCNPDPDSWVAKFLEWWIDQETGYPIPERAGVIRYMFQSGDGEVWADTREEAYSMAMTLGVFNDERLAENNLDADHLIKSVTFIPGSIFDNKIFIQKDPAYLGSLYALPEEERAMLLDGNWKIRTDGLGLCEFGAVRQLFDNYPERQERPLRCITCDAARFGRDFCVIMVWKGWEVVHISVYKKSDVNDIVSHIELLRQKFAIMKSNVLVDQDGVGGDSVKIGQYRGFRARDKPIRDPGSRVKENYENLNAQVAYRTAELINGGDIRINVTNSNCWIYDDSSLTPKPSTKIKVGAQVRDVKELIMEDCRAIKRHVRKDDKEPLKTNNKDEQKLILLRSPDFWDTIKMRMVFELKAPTKNFSAAA